MASSDTEENRDSSAHESFVIDEESTTVDIVGTDGQTIRHRLVYIRDKALGIEEMRLNALHQATNVHCNATYRWNPKADKADEDLPHEEYLAMRRREIIDTANTFLAFLTGEDA